MRFVAAIVLMAVSMAAIVPNAHAEQMVVVQINHGKLLTVKPVDRVVIAAPEIADVNVITRSQVMLIAKKLGETTVSMWSGPAITTYRVRVVGANVDDVGAALTEALGTSNIRVRMVEDTIILDGTVRTDVEKARAESTASAFGKRVVNLLTMEQPPATPAVALEGALRAALRDYPVTVSAPAPDTVRIEGVVSTQFDRQKIEAIAKSYAKNVVLLIQVRAPVQVQIATIVAEINRTALNQLGIEYGGGDSTNLLVNPYIFNFGYVTNGNIALQLLVARLHLLEQRNAARTLANPRLVVLDGQTSNLLVGGQVPIPTLGALGQTIVTFKDFGVRLEFKPTVRPDEPITLELLTEVSSLNFAQAIVANGFTIPTIDTRRVQTVVSLRPGEFLAIGGLIQRIDNKIVTKIPFLGDIPILGALFRSTSFQRGETELVIFVTPSLVTPTTSQPELPKAPNPDSLNP